MPRTILPTKTLAGIHPAVNCNYCTNMGNGATITDSDLLFTTACPKFAMVKYFHCRYHEQRIHWTVCAWRHYNDVFPACEDCRVGEGMVDVAQAIGHELQEED
jgi:hypothetical protein